MIAVYHHAEFTKYVHDRLAWRRPGLLTKVAEVDTDDEDEAYQLTNHIDESWLENAKVTPLVEKARSTSVGDVLVDYRSDGSVSSYVVVEPIGWRMLTDGEVQALGLQ
jgi:hypothetical protein